MRSRRGRKKGQRGKAVSSDLVPDETASTVKKGFLT
jgi:hypothetical protein